MIILCGWVTIILGGDVMISTNRQAHITRVQSVIDNTITKIEAAEELMALVDCEQTKRKLREKNQQRKEQLMQMREEIVNEKQFTRQM